jgi:hypothetical protein
VDASLLRLSGSYCKWYRCTIAIRQTHGRRFDELMAVVNREWDSEH